MGETKTFEICFEDLTPDAQKRYLEFIGEDEVNDFIPIAMIEIEKGDEKQWVVSSDVFQDL